MTGKLPETSTKPYPNEHAARVVDPSKFEPDSFRRKEIGARGVQMILGRPTSGGPMTVQAYRFPADKFTAAQARSWLAENNVDYISFEEATGEEEDDGEKKAQVELQAQAQGDVVKALGDWELDVLAVPFGGPDNGRDSDGEYFSEKTKTYPDKYPSPPAVYYHGYSPEGKPMGEPAFIGEVKSIEKRSDGWWYRVALDKASEFAKRIWNAAKEGLARASTGSIQHLVRKAANGEILVWPVAELSLIDTNAKRQPANTYAVALPVMKLHYSQVGKHLSDEEMADEEPEQETGSEGEQHSEPVAEEQPSPEEETITTKEGVTEMDEKDISKLVAEQVAAIEAEKALKAAEEARVKELETLKAENEKLKEEAAKTRRLPDGGQAPYQSKYAEETIYDGLDAADQAVLIGVLEAQKSHGKPGPSIAAYKALAHKLEEDKGEVGEIGRQAMKAAGMKADEVDYSTLASYGDDWVGVSYSQAIWEAIRAGTFVASKLPSVEVPKGTESIVLPLESTDPVFYKVAENTTYDSTMKYPVPTVTSSRLGTAKVTLTLAKMGARVLWTGELDERSLIPFANQLRSQLQAAGAEQLEHVIIDGDTEAAATTNINHIGGTPAASDLFMMFNGFRKSPIITTAANSRSAGGSLVVEDYIETIKLMGAGGINALDQAKVSFIVDVNTYWKTMGLAEVKTRDSFSSPTIENGVLTKLWGYSLYASAWMHYKSAVRKANTAGKVDQTTPANNTTGAILGVRWDQWKLGYQRRMTIETDRFAASDTNEIVAMMSVGLIQRDTEASAITYNVGV